MSLKVPNTANLEIQSSSLVLYESLDLREYIVNTTDMMSDISLKILETELKKIQTIKHSKIFSISYQIHNCSL